MRYVTTTHARTMPEDAERKITPNKPKTSKESHLREYWRLIKEGKTPYEARGSYKPESKGGDETYARYTVLMKLRKADKCPYGDDEADLREMWLHFKKAFPVLIKLSDADYLKIFAERYEQKQDLEFARGSPGAYLFKALKKIVDEEDLHFPELAEEEALLRRVWKYDEKRYAENSEMTHLQAFIDEYETNGGDFVKARGAWDTARYKVLLRLNNAKAEDYEEPYRAHIQKLQDVWETPDVTTWEKHLQVFIDEYETNGGDFAKARGAWDTARYRVLLRLTKAKAEDYEEPYRAHIQKLQDVWETPDVTTWEEHLRVFIDEYETNGGDFVKARGAHETSRYKTLRKLNNAKAEDYEEPYRSHIQKLQDVWETYTTWEEHLQAFIDEYETNGGDFVKARRAQGTARYATLRKLNKAKAEDYEEPYRAQIQKLKQLWLKNDIAKLGMSPEELVTQLNKQLTI